MSMVVIFLPYTDLNFTKFLSFILLLFIFGFFFYSRTGFQRLKIWVVTYILPKKTHRRSSNIKLFQPRYEIKMQLVSIESNYQFFLSIY